MLKIISDSIVGEPHRRRGHCSAVYEGGFYVWHGAWKEGDYHRYGTDEDPFSIHRLDLHTLKWETLQLKNGGGIKSEQFYALSCSSFTQNYRYVYTFGGHSMVGWLGTDPFFNTIYQIDLEELNITRLQCKGQSPLNRDKTSLMFYKDSLYLFGGWSRIPKTLQPGAKFVSHESYKMLGWNNEFFRYDLTAKEWTYQELKGEVPPPTAASAFARVGERAYLVAGRNPPDRVDDIYVLHLNTMEWRHHANPVHPAPPVPWPGPRSSHAVSPIYKTGGTQTPHLVLFGGLSPKDDAYSDVWVLDLSCMSWQQQLFQKNAAQKTAINGRTWFGMGAVLNTWSGCFEICLFGGVMGSLLDNLLQELANTQVMEMGISSLKRLACFAVIGDIQRLETYIEGLPTVLADNLRMLSKIKHSNAPLFSVISRFSPFKCFPDLSHLKL